MKTKEEVTAILTRKLGFPTVETRRSDRLDFREVAIWQLIEAIGEAYDAGYDAGANEVIDEI